MLTPNNQELGHYIGRCALKDQQAFSSLYEKTSGQLFAILLRVLKNKTLAEEALQEAFIKIWKNAGSYQADKGEPLAWLASIARYSALDLLRRQNTRSRYEDEYSEQALGDDASTQTTAFSDTEIEAGDSPLDQCLERLQPHARQSVVMAFCEGYTHEELSQRMNKPIGTVKSWIRRSLKRLQDCIYELSTT